MNDEDHPNTKAQEIQELLQYAKENYPAIAPLVKGRLNHIKRRYAGVFGAAIVACELLAQVLG